MNTTKQKSSHVEVENKCIVNRATNWATGTGYIHTITYKTDN